MSVSDEPDLEMLLRRIIREEGGITPVAPAEKWRGGSLVLKPGNGSQEKSWPIETFFHKVVMIRNRLRTLEQQVNGMDAPEDVKVKLQSYISGCYGSLTSFNVLFADEDDQFKGAAGDSQTGVRPGSDRGQTGVRPGSVPGSDQGQTSDMTRSSVVAAFPSGRLLI